MNTIGNRIKRRREQLNLTQDDLAKKLGYKSKTTIAKIETGVNDVSQSKLVSLAEALDTTPSYLMGWTDKNKEEFIIEQYNSLSPNNQKALEAYLAFLVEKDK